MEFFLSMYLEYYIFYLPNDFLTEGILNIIIDVLPMVLLCRMAWSIENKLSIVLQNIYSKKKSVYSLWNKKQIYLTEDSDRSKETVFPFSSLLSIGLYLVLLYFLSENNFVLCLASFSAVLSVCFLQSLGDEKIQWKRGLTYACLAPFIDLYCVNTLSFLIYHLFYAILLASFRKNCDNYH